MGMHEQLAHGCYSTVQRPGLELTTTESPVRCLSKPLDYLLRVLVTCSEAYYVKVIEV